MWPRGLGSVQPLRRCDADGLASSRPASPSAPQLTIRAPLSAPRPLSVLQVQDACPETGPKPQACMVPLMTADQLRGLDGMSADRAMTHIASSLPPDIPQRHASALTVLLYAVFRWAMKHQMDSEKMAALFTVYFDTYKFFLASPWRTQGQVYGYFKESLLRISVDHVPLSRRVLTPGECRAALMHFCSTCLAVLPLLRLAVAPNHRLDLQWTPQEQLVNVHML